MHKNINKVDHCENRSNKDEHVESMRESDLNDNDKNPNSESKMMKSVDFCQFSYDFPT